jgi:hypothetical protein
MKTFIFMVALLLAGCQHDCDLATHIIDSYDACAADSKCVHTQHEIENYKWAQHFRTVECVEIRYNETHWVSR